jgi:hypothetical protein
MIGKYSGLASSPKFQCKKHSKDQKGSERQQFAHGLLLDLFEDFLLALVSLCHYPFILIHPALLSKFAQKGNSYGLYLRANLDPVGEPCLPRCGTLLGQALLSLS